MTRNADQAAAEVSRAREAHEVSRLPLALGWPLLEVDTTDGYEPQLEVICDWVLTETGRTLPLAAPDAPST